MWLLDVEIAGITRAIHNSVTYTINSKVQPIQHASSTLALEDSAYYVVLGEPSQNQ